MKLRRTTGSLVLAAGLISGVFAVPAQADTVADLGTVDDLLTTLDGLGITDIAPGDAAALGQSVCPLLAERGQNTADIAGQLSDAIGRPLGPATMFTGTAISFLCPRAVERVTDNLVDGSPLLPLFGG
jgi:hypothetical protein